MLLFATVVAMLALALFARLTGWTDVARAYRLGPGARGPWSPTAGVLLGDWGWNAPPLRAELDDDGLALAPLQPFRLFFAPLFVPWGAIAAVEHRSYMFFDIVRLRCASGAAIGFLPSAVTAAILERLDKQPLTDAAIQRETRGP